MKDHKQITLIVQELERRDCLERQLNGLWAKILRVGRRYAEPEIQEERLLTDKKHFSVAQCSGSFQTLRILSKEKQRRNVADVNSSNAARCKNEETQSESIAHTNAGRVARSTTAWRAPCFGREDIGDEYDDLVGEQERTVCKQHRRSELWSYSGDEEWSDEENDELWSELESDDHYDCLYELLKMEALRQFDESKKAELASGNHVSLAAPDKKLQVDTCPRNFDVDA